MPSLQGAVKKIRSLLEMHKLEKVFVATDAVEEGKLVIITSGLVTPDSERSNDHFVSVNAWKFVSLHR